MTGLRPGPSRRPPGPSHDQHFERERTSRRARTDKPPIVGVTERGVGERGTTDGDRLGYRPPGPGQS